MMVPRQSQNNFLVAMLAVALALHAIERLVPPFPVPGVKIGLANIVTLVVLIGCGWKDALLITVLRVVGGSFLSGTFLGSGFYIALGGGLAAICGMQMARLAALLLPRPLFSVVGISCVGSVFHNLGQVLAAGCILHRFAVFRFLPWLVLLALPSGYLTGTVGRLLIGSLWKDKAPSESARRLMDVQRHTGDMCVAAFLLFSGVALLGLSFSHGQAAQRAVIEVNGERVKVLDLGTDGVSSLERANVRMSFEVKKHRVRVADSNCSNGYCVATGWIDKPGQAIICVPNGVVLSIAHDNPEEEIDTITY